MGHSSLEVVQAGLACWLAGGEDEQWKSRVGLSGPIKPTLIPARAGSALLPSPPPFPSSLPSPSQCLPPIHRRTVDR